MNITTIPQAADVLGISQVHARRLVQMGTLNGFRFGTVWAVDADDVEALAATRAALRKARQAARLSR